MCNLTKNQVSVASEDLKEYNKACTSRLAFCALGLAVKQVMFLDQLIKEVSKEISLQWLYVNLIDHNSKVTALVTGLIGADSKKALVAKLKKELNISDATDVAINLMLVNVNNGDDTDIKHLIKVAMHAVEMLGVSVNEARTNKTFIAAIESILLLPFCYTLTQVVNTVIDSDSSVYTNEDNGVDNDIDVSMEVKLVATGLINHGESTGEAEMVSVIVLSHKTGRIFTLVRDVDKNKRIRFKVNRDGSIDEDEENLLIKAITDLMPDSLFDDGSMKVKFSADVTVAAK